MITKTMEEVKNLKDNLKKVALNNNWDMFYIFPKLSYTKITTRNKIIQRIDLMNDNYTLYLRPNLVGLDLKKFNPKNRYEGWKLEDLSADRNDSIFTILESTKKWISGEDIEDIKNYCDAIIYGNYDNCDLNLESFVTGKKEKFNSWCDNTGYFRDTEIKDKELIFIKKGFIDTYRIGCYHCGSSYYNAYEKVVLKEINGHNYCSSCLDEKHLNYGKCEKSGKMSFRRTIKFKSDIDRMNVLKALGMDTNSKKSQFYIDRELVNSITGLRVCDRCYSSYMRSEDYDGGYCSDCRMGQIYSHGTKKYKILNSEGETDVKTHYGFELETHLNGSSDWDTAYAINKKIGDLVILKHDGSLDSGFEIVSHTLSYKRFFEEKPRFAAALKIAKSYGCYSQDTYKTGLHLHVSREGFKDADHLARFCRAWYEDKEFTRYIAQREFGEYRQWDDYEARNKNYFHEFLRANLYETHYSNRSRYNIVNLNNSDTVELRMFKGILNADYVAFSIELANLVKDYTENIKNSELNDISMIDSIIKHASRRLKAWINVYNLSKKYRIMEVK